MPDELKILNRSPGVLPEEDEDTSRLSKPASASPGDRQFTDGIDPETGQLRFSVPLNKSKSANVTESSSDGISRPIQHEVTGDEPVKIMPTFGEFVGELKRGAGITIDKAILGAGVDYVRLMAPELLNTQEMREAINAQQADIDKEKQVPADSLGGELARNIGRITVAMPTMFGAAKLVGAGPKAASWFAGISADLIAFDHGEERLSNGVAQIVDEHKGTPWFIEATVGTVADMLKADPNDPRLLGMTKQAAEGVLFGEILNRTVIKPGGVLIQEGYKMTKNISHEVYRGLSNVADAVRNIKNNQAGATVTPQHLKGTNTNTMGRPQEQVKAIRALDGEIAIQADRLLNQPFKESATGGAESAKRVLMMGDAMRAKIEALDVNKVLTKEDIDRKILAFENAAHERIKPSIDPAMNNALKGAFKENLDQVDQAYKYAHKTAWQKLKQGATQFHDKSAGIKKEIRKLPGGQHVVNMIDLAGGATAKASRYIEQAVDEIYPMFYDNKPVTRAEWNQMEELRLLNVMRDIKIRQPDYDLPLAAMPSLKTLVGKDGGKKITAGQLEQRMQAIRAELGFEKFNNIQYRVDRYFSEMRRGLDWLLDGDVISPEQYSKLARYQYSPMRYLQQVDPVVATINVGGKSQKLTASGLKEATIQELGEGAEAAMLTDGQAFLSQFLTRTSKAAAFNKANKALYESVEAQGGDAGIIRTKRPDKDMLGHFAEVSTFFDGKPKHMYIHKDYIDQWIAGPADLGSGIDTLQIASGAPLVRFGATGAGNPLFFLKSFPRELMFAWLHAGDGTLYSINPFKATKELSTDIKEVFSDVLHNGKMRTSQGQWVDNPDSLLRKAADEGLLMNFLTKQGSTSSVYNTQFKTSTHLQRGVQNVERVLNFANLTEEHLVRMAIVNRAIKSGKSLTDAVAEGRRIMDYSQGSNLSKSIDKVVPYFNTALQGFRVKVRSAVENPKTFLAKRSILWSTYAGAYMAGHYLYGQEKMSQVPSHVRDRNIPVLTPFTVMRNGTERQIGLRIPIDHSTMADKIMIDGIMDAYLAPDRYRSSTPARAIIQEFSFLDMSGVPTLNAVLALTAGIDPLTKKPVDPERFRNLLPESQYRTALESSNPTSYIARDLAQAVNPPLRELVGDPEFGINPARLDAAVGAVVPKNIFTDLFGGMYKNFSDTYLDEKNKYDLGNELIKNSGIPRGFIFETNPWSIDTEVGYQNILSTDHDFRRSEEVRRLFATAKNQNEGKALSADQIDALQKQIVYDSPFDTEKAFKTLDELRKMDEIFKQYDPDELTNVPPQIKWQQYSFMHPEAKALWVTDVLAEIQLDIDSGEKFRVKEGERAMKLMGRMLNEVPRFKVDNKSDFSYYLQEMALERGLELPAEIGKPSKKSR